MPKRTLLRELIAAARAARLNAHAPYSRFKVGAAVQSSDGKIYAGCNVENASYGLSICAERVAVCRAVTDGAKNIRTIAIVADFPIPCPPCGACRQFLLEFNPRMEIVMANCRGKVRTGHLQHLFPTPFTLTRRKKPAQ